MAESNSTTVAAKTSTGRKVFQKPIWTRKQGFVEGDDLLIGDHVWCHVPKSAKLVQHHGIWDGAGVFHFNKEGEKLDKKYVHDTEGQKCSTCECRMKQRQEAGLGGRSVRYNCLECFSHGQNVYICVYDASLMGRMFREAGSRTTRPCLRPGEEVVRVARWFYESDNFGKYEAFTHNCEDFARFCKIDKLGSKQSTRAIFVTGIAEISIVRSTITFVFCKVVRKWRERKLKKLKPDQV